MAYTGKVDSHDYHIVIEEDDYQTIQARKQVRVQGSHIYLLYIVPNPLNQTRGRFTQSRIQSRSLKTKKKIEIMISKEDLESIRSKTKALRLRSYVILDEELAKIRRVDRVTTTANKTYISL